METIKRILSFLYEKDGVFEQVCKGLLFGYCIAAMLGIIFSEERLILFGVVMTTIHIVAIFPYLLFAVWMEKLFGIKLLP